MKKNLFAFIAIMLSAVCANAQDIFVATLEHDGTYTRFYNNTALQKAVEAAVDGDVITLSEGQFTATDIKKSISVRGVGLSMLAQDRKTKITGNMNVYAQGENTTVNLEGLYFNDNTYLYLHCDGSEAAAGTVNVIKSRCYYVQMKNDNTPTAESTIATNFYNCLMNGEMNAQVSYSNVAFYNCYFSSYCYTQLSEVSNTKLLNCFINIQDLSYMNYAYSENCIFRFYGYYPLPSTSSAINCIGYASNSNGNTFSNVGYKSNCTYFGKVANSVVFSDINNYVLQDSIATQYLGTDGKQVGMYGGIGYTTKLRYPVISDIDISNGRATSRDGKLGVTIKLDNEK